MSSKRTVRGNSVLRRWLDLGLLCAFSLAIGFLLWPFLDTVGEKMGSLLSPWGWAVGLFLAIVAATTAWCIFESLGVNVAAIARISLWRTKKLSQNSIKG